MTCRGVAVILCLTGLLVGCAAARTTPTPVTLRAAGSTSWRPLMHDLATAYHAVQPLVTLEISGGNSAVGVQMVAAGHTDLGMVSDPQFDLPAGLQATTVARDAIALIVHPTNPLTDVTLIQARDVFAGRLSRWEAVGGSSGPIQVLSREDGSGTRAVFERGVMGDRRVTPTALVMPTSAAVVEWVADHPDAIGYVTMGYLDGSVKALTLEGMAPTPDNAATAAYPLTRELVLATPANPSPHVVAFLEYAVGPAGQAVVGQRYGKVR